jgi:arginyl-tRNA synthetase
MSIVNKIKDSVQLSLEQLYAQQVPADGITVNETKPEFEGDYTVVLFSFVKSLKKSPEQLGKRIG